MQINLLANTDLRSAAEFEELIVADRGGAIVRLRDVARVERGAEEADMIAKYNAIEGVYLGIWPVPGANKIESSIDCAMKWRASGRRCPPPDIDMQMVWDGTMFMQNALTEITKTLSETIVIVAVVVFLFMGSVRTALVPLVAIPVSLVGAVIFIPVFGFSLNLLTLLAIVLSVGLVVDDAIVVENVERHVRLGKSRIDAALSGLTGSLFLEFAITLAVAVVLSGVVAITLSSVMSSRFVHSQGKEGRLTAFVNRRFEESRRVYAWLLDRALIMRWGMVSAALGTAHHGHGLAAAPVFSVGARAG